MGIIGKIRDKLSFKTCAPLRYDVFLQKSYMGTSVVGGFLAGKNVVVTGGASGIGYAIACRYLAEGCRVWLTGRNEQKVKSAVLTLNDEFVDSRANFLLLDNLCAERLIAEIPVFVSEKRIDVWVNCAGVFTDVDRAKRFRSVLSTDYQNIVDTNLKSTYLISRLVASTMQKMQLKGQVINIASICGISACYGITPYGVSKAGVIEMTKCLKQQFGTDVIFNCVAPGSVATAMAHKKVGDNISAMGTKATRHVALPEEIASVVAFISGPAAPYINNLVVASASEKFY